MNMELMVKINNITYKLNQIVNGIIGSKISQEVDKIVFRINLKYVNIDIYVSISIIELERLDDEYLIYTIQQKIFKEVHKLILKKVN